MGLRVVFWGVRGSLPSSASPKKIKENFETLLKLFVSRGNTKADQVASFLDSWPLPDVGGYGTATTCVEVLSPRTQLIIDGGSGIRNLSEHIMRNVKPKGPVQYHIFLTHFHWDHLIGIPFFAPFFIPGNTINFYAVQPELEEMIRGKFKKPYFPVQFESLPAKVVFHQMEARKSFKLEDMSITPYQLDHPDPCWGAKVESAGKAYAHCVDTEGTRVSRESLGPDLPLYQGVDLMYFDAQYTLPELVEKANWGHSAAQLGLDIAFRENIKKVAFGHHDPGAVNGQVQDLIQQTEEYYTWRRRSAETNHTELPSVDWCFAYEGLEYRLG